ncbi:MAG: GTP-binding protein [Legionellaceae bacterium]|nr:GTP-binding protein [Legionellaceae bacterium]MBP9774764.1 GTP-binding protein [Legionellaceae bacterium]
MENKTKEIHIEQNVKIAFYGDSGVGKTTLAMRWGSDTLHETYQASLGVDFESKTISDAELGLILDLQIWDIDGQKQFEFMMPFYLQETKWVVLVFSVTDRNSFNNLLHYFDIARANVHTKAHYFILANKTDLEAERQVSTAEAEMFAREQHTAYIETSAKTRMGLDQLEQTILRVVTHCRAKAEGVRATDIPQSFYGNHAKQEGAGATKTLRPRPETVTTLNRQSCL